MPLTNVKARWDRGNQIFYDSLHLRRVVDVVGPGVQFKLPSLGQDMQPATIDPAGWTSTVVEVGAGTSEINPSSEVGFLADVITAANENDGIQSQAPGAAFRCLSDVSWYLGMEFQINDVVQSDLLFGVCITDATLLGGMSDGAYLESLDASASVSGVTEKDSTEEQTDTIGTLVAATNQIWEVMWDGAIVTFWVDGVLVASHSTTLPDNEGLRASIAFLTGEAVAQTIKVAWMRGFVWS